ncbi:glycosyltransferase [Chthonobacter albigriseus]|uniref:glycosyltransferase n=1 Tax=Chthonobacter albigriseus TaxID=1683161 RepID=UPI0015EF30AF|nr:glycosyltransferase [Chthonobacter albigriseus]
MANTRASAGKALESAWAHAAYVLFVAALALALPENAFHAEEKGVLLAVGLIGMWRYGWGILHFVRSIWFRTITFPAMRREAIARSAAAPGHAFLLITSFRIDANTTMRVYRAAFEAALAAPAGATVVASIVEMGDQRIIRRVFELTVGDKPGVELVFVRIAGSGKRDALAHGFRAIQARDPGENDTVAVIDGDSIVPKDLIAKCAPFFQLGPEVGALTTDEICEVEGREIFREWYSLRFAQRQILMCSMGLSRRVLTLTGRMSMFRARIACDPDFIEHVQEDAIDHWRLGRVKFLTGDDKSSWYWLLQRGYQMLYVPDVIVETIEQPPANGFVDSAAMLMVRWFGNMLRTNGRAIALGPHRLGFFTWWAILDQRLSMWTCLTGVAFALVGTLFVNPFAFVFYLIWVLTSRYVMTLFLLSVRDRVSISYPFLIFFNQIFGSLMKVYIFFRLDRQKWTRQNTVSKRNVSAWRARYNTYSSLFMNVFAVALFLTAVSVTAGVLELR